MRLSLCNDLQIPKELYKHCIKKFDSREFEVLQQLFKELSGRSQTPGIDKETFLQYFNLPGLWGERLFRHFDIDDSNSVEFEEFMVGISICCRGTRTEKINVLFHVFDLNEDGLIQKSELVAMLSNFPMMTMHMTHGMKPQKSHTGHGGNQCSVLEHRSCSLSNYGKFATRTDMRGGPHFKKCADPLCGVVAGTSAINEFDKPMCVKKVAHHDTMAFKELVSSLSRLSFQSVVSSEPWSKTDKVESAYHKSSFYHNLESVMTPRRSQHDIELRRSCSATVLDQLVEAEPPCLYDDPPTQDKFMRIVNCASIDRYRGSITSDSQNSDIYTTEDFHFSLPNLNVPSYASKNPREDEVTITSSNHGRDENVRRCIQGLDEAESYRKSHCDLSPRIHDSTPASIAAMAIIDQDRLIDVDSITMDILVESILEDCEFNENASLDFDMFKVWLSKDCSVLTMFSEYMHEEVWGLQGNAFMTSPESHEFFLNNAPGMHVLSTVEFGEIEKGMNDVVQVDAHDKLAQRMVYQMFLVNGTEAQAFKQCVSSLENVVSEELLQYLHQVSSRIESKNNRQKGAAAAAREGAIETPNSSGPLSKDIFSCPNCGTPFFMCPVCFNRHESLSLHLDSGVYIACDNCTTHNKNARFTSCWICDWSFSEAMQMALSKRRQREKSILLRRRRASMRISPLRRSRIVSRHSLKTRRSEDKLQRTLAKSSTSPYLISPGASRKTMPVGPTASISATNSIPMSKSHTTAPPNTLRSHGSLGKGGDWSIARAKVPIKAGYMFKHGKHFNKLKRRYFVLIDNVLYYYYDKESANPRGCIFLEGCFLDSLSNRDHMSDMYGLCISHKANKFNRREFYVTSKADFFEWIEVLSVAMKQQSLMQLYTICEQLGHGKFSVVYRAIYKSTGEEFAVKIVDKTKIGGQERELLRSEIAILRLLRHKHVIYLKDVSDTCDSLYIVMELVKGGELYDLINQEHRLSEAHTHKIICQLLEIVAYLHKCGIIHRDIKPENILLTDKTEGATIKLTDFGLSTLCGPNELLTQPCGTLAYVAPEVLTLQGYNQKADVWSIGVIMYLLLRGRLPFSIKHPAGVDMSKHYCVSFEGRYWEGVSTSAKDLISRMLDLNPSNRITVFEALDHIWVKNFVAVNYDDSLGGGGGGAGGGMGNMESTTELINSLRNTTDTTFVIPYTESCIQNIRALQNDAAESRDKPLGTVEE